ncbi:hypothetical protein [Nocardioides sp.]|uniref:hypothetical protein n=1 Tax=Nocardioides sp. TaxID=35761 RepID=UPI003D10488F
MTAVALHESQIHDHDDVVVDTNVLAHSDNRHSTFHADALEFLLWLIDGSEHNWVLDDNGKDAPLLKTSLIWTEYQETLSQVSSAMLLFKSALDTGRVCFATRPSQAQRLLIRGLVPRNRKDRVVLGAAANSGSKWLVTNDFDDFDDPTRAACQSLLDVSVTDALKPT